jgi:hypothetical protein
MIGSSLDSSLDSARAGAGATISDSFSSSTGRFPD